MTTPTTDDALRDVIEALEPVISDNGWLSHNADEETLSKCASFLGYHADTLRRALAAMEAVEAAPVAIMDTRDVLGICAPTEDDFPALYALQGQRVALVRVGEG
jgi:hypothetical protein